MCCLFYFVLHGTFFKGTGKSGIFGVFSCFFYVGIKKREVYFGWVQLHYGRLIDFLSQISKLSNFSLLDFADFRMHRYFPVSFFVLIRSHTCACNMCFVSSFVIHWQFRRINHNGSPNPLSVLSP